MTSEWRVRKTYLPPKCWIDNILIGRELFPEIVGGHCVTVSSSNPAETFNAKSWFPLAIFLETMTMLH